MTDAHSEGRPPHERDTRRTVRTVLGVVLLVIVVALVVDNRDDVRIGYVFGDVRIPLALVIVLSLLVGVAVGWLFGRRGRRDE
ncbi:MAG TPA: LapA family protein [Acidimicrobiia bacterium]